MEKRFTQEPGAVCRSLDTPEPLVTDTPFEEWSWITTDDGAITASNNALRQTIGHAPATSEALGVLLPEEWQELLNAALSRGRGHGPLHVRTTQATVIELNTTTRSLPDTGNRVLVVWTALPRDPATVTLPAMESEQLLDTMLGLIPAYIYFKDRESRFVRWSRSLERLFNLKEKTSLLGLTDSDFFEGDHAGEAREDELRIMETGKPITGKLEMETHRDGRLTWALTTKVPWRDEEGRVLGTLGISKDVTALKEAEARLEAAHRDLVDASRTAGMAEVACDVLHNVGNVLNSINVSCSVLRDRLGRSRLSSLGRLADLVASSGDSAEPEATPAPSQARISGYLTELAKHLEQERQAWLDELSLLGRNVEHISEIITTQQDYARMAGIVEAVDMAQLIEDALRINAAALMRHRVDVIRELDALPTLRTIKHKVLQILVNLVRNAKYAVSAAGKDHGWVRITAERHADQLTLKVIDNGVGMTGDQLKRIFHHGFTTRRNGHGFGLHSCAITAAELNGTLQAESAGPGQGATFTLTLPLELRPPRP